MRFLILLTCLLVCSLTSFIDPCVLFLEGVHSSLNPAAETTDLSNFNCSAVVTDQLLSKIHAPEREKAIAFHNFFTQIYGARILADLEGQTLTDFFDGVIEKDYFKMGSVLGGISNWITEVRGFWHEYGFCNGYGVWQKSAPITYQKDWKRNSFIFMYQQGVGILRHDPDDLTYWPDKIFKPVSESEVILWGFSGSSLVVSNQGLIQVFDDPVNMDKDTKPNKIQRQQVPLFPTYMLPFSIKSDGPSNLQINSEDYLFLFKNPKGYIFNPKKFPSDTPLEFEFKEFVRSSVIIKLENLEPIYQKKNFLVTCSLDGEVSLISFESDGKKLEFPDPWVIRSKVKGEDNPPNNLLFIRTAKGYLLFLNTGTKILWYDLSANFKVTQSRGVWHDTSLTGDIQKMVYGVDPISQQDHLYVASIRNKYCVFDAFNLMSMRINPSIKFEDFQKNEIQVFSMQYSIDKTKLTREGKPFFFLAMKQWGFFSDTVKFYKGDWNLQKNKYEWKSIGYTSEGRSSDALSVFSFPRDNYHAQNPNLQRDIAEVGMNGAPDFVYGYPKIQIMPTSQVYGESLSIKQATTNNSEDWYLPAPLQYTKWCWAACVSAVFNFHRRNEPTAQLTQCEVVNKYFGRTDCCTMPRPNDCRLKGNAAYALEKDYNFGRLQLEDFSFPRIKAEIDNNHLIFASIRGDHVVILLGYSEDPNPDGYGSEWILMWNPTQVTVYHGFNWYSFDEFARRAIKKPGDKDPYINILFDKTNV